ncbi:MAG: ATP-binding protein [Pseudomonadales bacterium]|nr:hypothetical protein [Pseudomonadales bacterium]
MRIFNRIRGPRIGIKLALLGSLLLVVPFFSYRQVVEMERLLLEGQRNTQLLKAKGIATLFNGRDSLFNDLPVSTSDYEPLFVQPLSGAVRIDGQGDDWGMNLDDSMMGFGSPTGDRDGDLRLLLGERNGQLYGFLRVRDAEHVWRDENILRLDKSDQIRISFIRTDGEDGRIALVGSPAAPLTAYAMDDGWRFAADGPPELRIQGAMVATGSGVDVEFRMPLDMLGSRRHFGVAYVDVDDPVERNIRQVTHTLPTADKAGFDLVVLQSPEVRRIVDGLGYAGARILVLDERGRVRAETGAIPDAGNTTTHQGVMDRARDLFETIRPLLHRITTGERYDPEAISVAESQETASEVIAAALRGEPIARRRKLGNNQIVIMAAHPIYSKDAVVGSVVVEENIDAIVSFQRSSLERVVLVSVASLLIVVLSLIAYAARLAWRIRHLRREASRAIDQYGRLRTPSLRAEMLAGDEIGDLARSVSGMLSKLHQHNTFLENMPRTLRHEINNPLNILSTSLDNLATEVPGVLDSKYLDSARRGVLRIGSIVQNLADAANLDDALLAEEMEIIDIDELLQNYVANCSLSHPGCQFVYRGADRPVYAKLADYRIEQMLDKIIDNAIDFHRSNSPIKVQLDVSRDSLQITVANRGPTLPPRAERTLFDSMVSHRGQDNRLHFGLGLYVVRVIVEHHGGHVRAMNLVDGSGVAIMVQLPLAQAAGNGVDAPRPVLARSA